MLCYSPERCTNSGGVVKPSGRERLQRVALAMPAAWVAQVDRAAEMLRLSRSSMLCELLVVPIGKLAGFTEGGDGEEFLNVLLDEPVRRMRGRSEGRVRRRVRAALKIARRRHAAAA